MNMKKKIGRFLWDTKYNARVCDKRSKRYNTIKQTFEARRSRLLGRGLSEADSLIERLHTYTRNKS